MKCGIFMLELSEIWPFPAWLAVFFQKVLGVQFLSFLLLRLPALIQFLLFFDQTHCYFALLVSSYSNIRTGENLLKYCAYILHTKSILCEQLMFIFIPDLIFIDSSLVFLHSQFHAFMACLDWGLAGKCLPDNESWPRRPKSDAWEACLGQASFWSLET